MSEPQRLSDHVRVGLALSGGGGRGLAQIGALRVLEREGVPVHLVAGTSIGSIIGGLYALHLSADEVERRVLGVLASPLVEGLGLQHILKMSGGVAVQERAAVNHEGLLARAGKLVRRVVASHAALTRPAVLDGEAVHEVFTHLFGDATFDRTQIPFAAVAVDVEECREVIVTTGSLARGVAASSAIAGFFPPVRVGAHTLIDGGYTSPVPIDAAHTLGANVVIAVDVSERGRNPGRLGNAVEMAMRASEISLVALEREQLRRADVVIPARGQPRHWSDYSEPQEAIRAGEAAAERMLDSIHAAIEERAQLFV